MTKEEMKKERIASKRQQAEDTKEIYDAFVTEGFTEEIAAELTKIHFGFILNVNLIIQQQKQAQAQAQGGGGLHVIP